MKILILIITFYSLTIISCSGHDIVDEFPMIHFRQDNSLLSQPSSYEKLSFSTPLGFEKIAKDKLQSIKNELAINKTKFFNSDIISIFQHSYGHVIILSKIINSKIFYKKLNDEFESSLIESLGATKTSKGQFLINGKETVQFITTNDNYVSCKLFYNVLGSDCFIIDFFVPINQYVKFQSSIESSISTISIK